MSEVTTKILKVMRQALDQSAGEGEGLNAWNIAFRMAKQANVKLEDLIQTQDCGPQIVIDSGEPPEFNVRMPWGKYRGQTLKCIYQDNMGYLSWVASGRATLADPALIRACQVVLNGGN